MAQFLILTDTQLLPQVGRLTAGDIISDTTYDISFLEQQGVALVEFQNSMQSAVNAFLAARDQTGEKTVIPYLAARNQVPFPVRGLPVDIYVDGDSGLDTNDGSSGKPLQTLTEALKRVPLTLYQTYNIRLRQASSPYDGDYLLGNAWSCLGGSLHIIGEDSTVLASGTAQAGSGNAVCATTGGLTPDAFIGKTLSVTLSAWGGRISKKMIIQNDATDIRACFGAYDETTFGVVPISIGDAYEVTEPTVTIEISGGFLGGAKNSAQNTPSGETAVFNTSKTFTMRMFNLDFQAKGAFASVGAAGDVVAYGCEFSTGGGFFSLYFPKAGVDAPGGSLLSSPDQENAEVTIDGQGIDRQGQLTGWGLFANGPMTSPTQFLGIVATGGWSTPQAYQVVQIIAGRFFGVSGGTSSAFEVGQRDSIAPAGGEVVVGGKFVAYPDAQVLIEPTGALTFADPIIYVSGSARLSAGGALVINDPTAGRDGVLSDGGRALLGRDVSITVTRYGCYARGTGRCLIEDPAAISGGSANFAAGETPQTGATVDRANPVVATTPADGSACAFVD